MSSYARKTINCKCCGRPFEARLLKSFSAFGSIDLDTNTHEPAMFDSVVICPNCGYATRRIHADVDDKTRDLVMNDREYHAVLRGPEYSENTRKCVLAGMIAEKTGNISEAWYCYMLAFWSEKEAGSALEDAFRSKTIECLSLYLMSEEDHDGGMILVDLLRQSGRFDEAQETIDSLEEFLDPDTNIMAVAGLERRLIAAGDSSTHTISEAFE